MSPRVHRVRKRSNTDPLGPMTPEESSEMKEETDDSTVVHINRIKPLREASSNWKSTSDVPQHLSRRKRSDAMAQLSMYTKSGKVWIRKKGRTGMITWKERFFYLQGGVIQSYLSCNDTKPKFVFNLVVMQCRRAEGALKDTGRFKHVFELSTYGKEYYVATENEEDLQQWVSTIERVKHHIFAYGIEPSSPIVPSPHKFLSTLERLTISHSKRDNLVLEVADGKSRAGISPNGKTGRDAVIQEIIQTEEDYLNDLHVIINHYLASLLTFKQMTKHQKDEVFGNIEEIIPIHQHLLSQLHEEMKVGGDHTPRIGAAFLDIAPQLKAYINYCNSQASSGESIELLVASDENLFHCLKSLNADPIARGVELCDYLIKPMQRLCKYPLLLRELLRETPSDDPDREQLQQALTIIQQNIGVVNDQKRQVDDLLALIDLQNQFVDRFLSLQAKGRRLLATASFRKVSVDGSAPSKATLWLLTDMILIGRKKEKGKYFFRGQIELVHMQLEDADRLLSERRNCFTLLNREESGPNKINVYASTPEQKLDWMNLIREAAEQVQ